MGIMDFFKKGEEREIKDPRPTPANQTQTKTYTIQSGDTLSKIAKAHYGDAQDWRKIYEANEKTIKDPDKIFPGQEIIIPMENQNQTASNSNQSSSSEINGLGSFNAKNQ